MTALDTLKLWVENANTTLQYYKFVPEPSSSLPLEQYPVENKVLFDDEGNTVRLLGLLTASGAEPTQAEIDAIEDGLSSGDLEIEPESDSVDDYPLEVLIQDSFPDEPYNGQKVRRTDLDYTDWVYVEPLKEWWSHGYYDGGGVSGSTSNNQYFRRFNGGVMSTNVGIALPERVRIRKVLGTFSSVENGSVVVRLNGTTGDREAPVPNNRKLNFTAPLTSSWLLGDVSDNLDVLGLSWKQGTTGAANACQLSIKGVYVRFAGE